MQISEDDITDFKDEVSNYWQYGLYFKTILDPLKNHFNIDEFLRKYDMRVKTFDPVRYYIVPCSAIFRENPGFTGNEIYQGIFAYVLDIVYKTPKQKYITIMTENRDYVLFSTRFIPLFSNQHLMFIDYNGDNSQIDIRKIKNFDRYYNENDITPLIISDIKTKVDGKKIWTVDQTGYFTVLMIYFNIKYEEVIKNYLPLNYKNRVKLGTQNYYIYYQTSLNDILDKKSKSKLTYINIFEVIKTLIVGSIGKFSFYYQLY